MDRAGPSRSGFLVDPIPHRKWRTGIEFLFLIGLMVLLIAVLMANVQKPAITFSLVIAFAVSIGIFVFALTRISRHLHHTQRVTASALKTTEEEIRQMAGNIQEIFWMVDARNEKDAAA